jgi:hypothetical protein
MKNGIELLWCVILLRQQPATGRSSSQRQANNNLFVRSVSGISRPTKISDRTDETDGASECHLG